jgi:hypothetical protein
LLLGALCLGSAASATDAIECGTDLVAVGDSESELLQKCGEPTSRNGNQWTYDQGPNSLLKIVTVGNGKVISIHVGERAN